jgi:predicted membrane protein
MMIPKFSASNWLGAIVVLVGVMLLINNVFNLGIPIFTIILSFGLIWIGILLIRGSVLTKEDSARTVFGESKMNHTPGQQNYSVTFGSVTLNLQDFRPDKPESLNLDCTFGEMKVIVSREVELQISGNSSFGSLSGPDLQAATFGTYRYNSPGFNSLQPGISLNARVTFGEIKIFYL